MFAIPFAPPPQMVQHQPHPQQKRAPEPEDDGFVPDPEFRRRIEELAAREDFQSEQGQADLRHLVEDVVSGMREEQRGQDRSTRQRTD